MNIEVEASHAEWEYGRLLRQPSPETSLARPLPPKEEAEDERMSDQSSRRGIKRSRHFMGSPMPASPTRWTPTTTLRSLKSKSTTTGGKRDDFDIFVLILQSSGTQEIITRAGRDVEVNTLLVADQTASFVKLTLWTHVARSAGRLIRPGDLVRFNRIGTNLFQGTLQGKSSSRTSFRVVWRDDCFIDPRDLACTSLQDQQPHLEAETAAADLAVDRGAACDLAVWAKREFPSVTSRAAPGAGTPAGAGTMPSYASSLANVRQGVEMTVLASVLAVSDADQLWIWGSSGGE
ncbi:unnamed protein product [Discosporangium mesarthrocarpum]